MINTLFILLKRWPIGCLLVFIAGCHSNATMYNLMNSRPDATPIEGRSGRAVTLITSARKLIRSGDIILRTGNDFTSESLRHLSLADNTYSHCGIALIENDSLFIYHALGGEWNPDAKLRRDPLADFCDPEYNRGFGIYRFAFNPTQVHQLDSVVKRWYHIPITFDMNFDLKTDDKMYCAEFVSKAVNTATNNETRFKTTTINHFTYMAVDDIFLQPGCLRVKRFLYR